MKSNIHPTWYPNCKVTCACGNTFMIGTTLPQINVEVCYKCHPYYTGQMKYVDTAGRVEAFQARKGKAAEKTLSKAEKRRLKKLKKIQEEMEKPETLAELRSEKVAQVAKVPQVSQE